MKDADRPLLTCWKEIAAFFGKGLRTVQRWEAYGLPIHRPTGERSIVFAKPDELIAWATSQPTVVGHRHSTVADRLGEMSFHEQTPLLRSMEQHLGRPLTPAERKLLALAEDLMKPENKPEPEANAQSTSD